MPAELPVKAYAIRVSSHHLQLDASDLLGFEPLQRECQDTAADAAATERIGNKHLADSANGCRAEIRRESANASCDKGNDFAVDLTNYDVCKAPQKRRNGLEPRVVGA